MNALESFDGGFSTLEVSSRSTILFFFEKWRRSHGFSLLIMMLHWVPPNFTSTSALTGKDGWESNRHQNQKINQLDTKTKK